MRDMIDERGLDNVDYDIIAELMVREEPMTGKDFRGISKPSTHLNRLEKKKLLTSEWKYTDEYGHCKYYKPNKSNLAKKGIINKHGQGYDIELGKTKHKFTLGLDSPTERGLCSLFSGLDRMKKGNLKLWKLLLKAQVKGLYHYFVETEEGFLTEKQSLAKKKKIMKMEKDELEKIMSECKGLTL